MLKQFDAKLEIEIKNYIHNDIFNNETNLKKVIESINSYNSLVKLVLLPSDKFIWESCSKILNLIEFEKVSLYLDLVLEWYQDLNWPGIRNITNLLIDHKSELNINILEKVIKNAFKSNDEMWLVGLKYLVIKLDFLNNKHLSDHCLNILRSVDWVTDSKSKVGNCI